MACEKDIHHVPRKVDSRCLACEVEGTRPRGHGKKLLTMT